MKPRYWVVGLAVIALAAGGGFYFGTLSNGKMAHTGATATKSASKILYYKNPMGLADTSPTPKQDSMGMDYIPVYDNEAEQSETVHVDPRRLQLLGVQSQAVKLQKIGSEMRALGTVELAETGLYTVSPRFEGWVSKLIVNTTGQAINKGEILFETQIPDLFYAEFAYRQAVKKTLDTAAAAPEINKAAELEVVRAMERLERLGASDEEMQRLAQGGEPAKTMRYRSPANGVVIEKSVTEGMRFAPGDKLYQLADLSQLWLSVQLPESALSKVRLGDSLQFSLTTHPQDTQKAKVDFIYPQIDGESRGFKLRATLNNSRNLIKPGQTAQVWLQSQTRTALTIPANALLDSGSRQWVILALNEGVYQPRQVKVGERQQEWVEILEGLSADEKVVTQANFLIDSESRLQAALANFGNSSSAAASAPKSAQTTGAGQ